MATATETVTEPAPTRRRPGWPAVVATATAVFAVLCSARLGEQAFWRDEVYSAYISSRPFGHMIDIIQQRESNMPLYYLLLHGWTRLGDGEGWLRLPSVAAAAGSIPVAAAIARRAVGAAAAAVTAVLLAGSVFLVGMAREARSYAFMTLMLAVATLLLMRAVQSGRTDIRTFVPYAVAAVTACYLHPLSALVIAAHGASLLVLPRARLPLRGLVTAYLAIVLAVVPVLAYLYATQRGQTSWIPPLSVQAVRGVPYVFSGGGDATTLAWALLAVLGLVRLARDWRAATATDRWARVVIVLWLGLPPLLLAALSVVKPLFISRYVASIVLPLVILIGYGIVSLGRRVGVAVLAVMVGLSVVNLSGLLGSPRPEDPRAAVADVVACRRPGDVVTYAPAHARMAFDYYLQRLSPGGGPQDVAVAAGGSRAEIGDEYPRELEPAALRRRLDQAPRVWVVSYVPNVWHPTPEPMIALLDGGFGADRRVISDRRYGEMRVQLLVRGDGAATDSCAGAAAG